MFDVLIIGGGVIGCSVANQLSQYQLKVGVIERSSDVCELTSKANSGIVHSGVDAKVGSRKAYFNLLGNRMMASFCQQYGVPYHQNGSLILCFSELDYPKLEILYRQGLENGVQGLRLLSKEEVLQLEPNLNPNLFAALHAPTGGIVDPFKLTLMQAEVAKMNGVEFFLNTTLYHLAKKEHFYQLETNLGVFQSKTVINCAGIYADYWNNQVSNRKLSITPRKGEYCLFDKQVGNVVKHTVFQLPNEFGKGVVVTPTAEGNLLIGPTAYDIEDKEDIATTKEGIAYVVQKAKESIKDVPMSFVITAFAGLRATEKGGDFIIGEAEDAEGFFNAAGIESPGLTAAPAIGAYLASLVSDKLKASKKRNFVESNKGIIDFEKASIEEKKALIDQNREYGQIVCRCELITLAQIKEAIHRPLGATTLDAIKRRTRAGSGRCQGGFCAPRIVEILSKELKKDPREIAKFGDKSTFLIGLDKELE